MEIQNKDAEEEDSAAVCCAETTEKTEQKLVKTETMIKKTNNKDSKQNVKPSEYIDMFECDTEVIQREFEVKGGTLQVLDAIEVKNNKDIRKEELQEEDVPESFFDDLMSEDFIEGLNVVDAWEGDEPNQNLSAEDSKAQMLNSILSPNSSNNKQRRRSRTSSEKRSEKHRKRSKQGKDKSRNIRNTSKSKERRSKRSRSRSKSHKINDNSRRDPSKTQRDILRDKDKCEKDKSAKILHEKLKVVETGLVPPGMEMEVDMQHSETTNKLEEGELLPEEDEVVSVRKVKSRSIERRRTIAEMKLSSERKRDSRHSKSLHSKHSPVRLKREVSPLYRRERRIRSRSRSPRRWSPAYIRSRSIERRIERRRRSPRRTRSRSLDRRSPSKERKYKYNSPSRKTSPLINRTDSLFRHLDLFKSKLFPNDLLTKSIVGQHNIQTSNLNVPQNYVNNSLQFLPTANQNFIPLQPVPPPNHTPVELDQQFFIGQPAFEPSYSAPMQQQLQLMQEPAMPLLLGVSDIQHNFQQDWHTNQPMNFFVPDNQFNSQQNNFQPLMGLPIDLPENPESLPPQQFPFLIQNQGVPIPVENKQNEEEIFIKLFADNKITLTDYLSLTAKSTDNSHPVDIQNKIKVISHCQEALSEINEASKASGKFLLRKSQKCPIKASSGEGLSPFKKVPAIKFQFTTCSKQVDDKQYFSSSLNRLLRRLGKEAIFQETCAPVAVSNLKSMEHKKASADVKQTCNISTQTDPPSVSDFGCQVTFEEVPSPMKSILKQQSLAKLTPAQLLAQAEKETSPPPAPRWSPADKELTRRNDVYRDLDMSDRFLRGPGMNKWPNHSRNLASNTSFYNRSPDDLNHHYYENRHQNF
ncbi:hypothetical protein AMK59_3422 [Oryctes borbonicus]|uniref:Uncharacterized protein n=1 Tax=Oryctes borbonicus TaxID=1629725 RepID=A0A0T6B9E9_9SCAR|nr:hypothetical protein AMK59_3422 [Oryctes borbonicus]